MSVHLGTRLRPLLAIARYAEQKSGLFPNTPPASSVERQDEWLTLIWLAVFLIVAVDCLRFGGDGNLNVSTLFEPHIVTMFVG